MRSLGKRVSILAVGLLCGLAVVFTGASILMNMSAAPTKYEVAVFVQGTTQTQNRSLSEEDIKDYIQQGYVLYGFDVNNQRVEYDPEAEDAIAISKFIELYSSVKLDRVGEAAASKVVTLVVNGGSITNYTVPENVDFVNNVITLNDGESCDLPTAEQITKANHKFLGWSSDQSTVISQDTPVFNTPIASVTYTNIADAVTYYAIWSELKTITLDVNGGNALPQGEETITFTYADVYGGESYTTALNAKLVTPTRAGANFAGWFTANGTQVTSISTFANDFANFTSQTLKAHWSKTITLDVNGGNALPQGEETITFTPSDFVSEDSTTALNAKFKAIERTDYAFIGWFTAAEGGNKVTKIESFEDYATGTTFYAQWAKDKTIILNLDGGELEQGLQTTNKISFGNTFTLPTGEQITKEGYTFVGWQIDGKQGYVTEVAFESLVAEETTIIAIWSIKTFSLTLPTEPSGYTISVKADGSNDEIASGAVLNYGTVLTITLTLTLQDTAFSQKEVPGLDYDDSDITINGQTVIITGKVIGAVTFNIVVENATFTANGIKYEIISATEVKVSSITTQALTQSVRYTLDNGTYVEQIATHHTKLVIPSSVTNAEKTYDVTQIASTATNNIKGETTVETVKYYIGYLVIPSSITVIEDGAFNDCTKLGTIVIDINAELQAGVNAFGNPGTAKENRTVYLTAAQTILKTIDYSTYGNLLVNATTIYIQGSSESDAVKEFKTNTNLCDVFGVGVSHFEVPQTNKEVQLNAVPNQEKTNLTGGTTYTKFILTEETI